MQAEDKLVSYLTDVRTASVAVNCAGFKGLTADENPAADARVVATIKYGWPAVNRHLEMNDQIPHQWPPSVRQYLRTTLFSQAKNINPEIWNWIDAFTDEVANLYSSTIPKFKSL